MLSYETRFNIAGIGFSVKANRLKPIDWLKERYGMYLTDANAEVKISLYYHTDTPHSSKDKLFSKPYTIYGDIKKRYEFRVYTKKGYIGIGSLLRFLSSIIFIKRGGMLLHSCGVILDDDAYLLSGPSGVGKTTIARLINNKYTLLSDETVAVIKNYKGYYAYATPFFGDFGSITSNDKGKLKAILFLKQSGHFKHKRLRSVSALARLLQNIFYFGDGLSYNMDKVIDVAFDITKKIPCYELEFLPHKNICKYIKDRIFPGV